MLVVSCVLWHEAGHLLAFFALREPPPKFDAVLLGMTLSPQRPMSYGHTLTVALAGPLASLSAAALLFLLFPNSFGALSLSLVHLLLGIVNLVPMGKSDGGVAAEALLLLLLPLPLAERIRSALSFFAFFALLFLLLFLLLRGGGTGALILLLSLLARRKSTA